MLLNYLGYSNLYGHKLNVSVYMSLLPFSIIRGVHINKRILILFVVVSYPFFTDEHIC